MLEAMSALSTRVARLVNGGRELLFPPACLFCHVPLAAGEACCGDCLAAIEVYPRSGCRLCGAILPAGLAPGPCGRCLASPPPQLSCHSLYSYSGPVRDALLAWKLEGRDGGVRWLTERAAGEIARMIPSDALLLPVPMPLSRMRKRGQHHAADLCRQLAACSGAQMEWRLLRRIGEQPRQSELSGRARRHNLRGAFALAVDAAALLGDARELWIVDDILTTGSTLHHAARVALRCGRPVHLLSLARTISER